MDYRYPLSAFQAFAICLSSFDTKLACEWEVTVIGGRFACISEGCSDWKEHMEPVPAVGSMVRVFVLG
jgi:hypothetical protein